MKTIAYPIRIPLEVLEVAKLRASEEYVDQATALRQLLYSGMEKYVLSLVASGRISISKAAELCGKSIQEVQILSEKHGVELGPTEDQQRKSKETLKKILKN